MAPRPMTIPVLVLVLFAGWTVLTLLATVGVYRWSRILRGRADLSDFPADRPHGSDWYQRAMRAHANCIENLPLYGAVVVAIVATGVHGAALDALAIALLAGRVLQTLTHVGFRQTNRAIAVRFTFYLAQLACIVAMGVRVLVLAR